MRKVLSLFFGTFSLVLTKYLFWKKALALGYHSMTFTHFLEVSSLLATRDATRIYHVYK